MSAGAAVLANPANRVPRWSSTSRADPRPKWCPALLAARHSSQTGVVIGVPAMTIGLISRHNQSTGAPPLLATGHRTAVKSP
jgi:hypothetical protein